MFDEDLFLFLLVAHRCTMCLSNLLVFAEFLRLTWHGVCLVFAVVDREMVLQVCNIMHY